MYWRAYRATIVRVLVAHPNEPPPPTAVLLRRSVFLGDLEAFVSRRSEVASYSRCILTYFKKTSAVG